jgi:integrase
MTLAAARERARELAEALAQGEDPRSVERARRQGYGARVTVKEFAARYLKNLEARGARKDMAAVRRPLEREIVRRLGARPMDKVTARELQALIFGKLEAGRPAAAAKLRGLCKRVWDYAMVCGVADSNPAISTPLRYVARRKARDRALSEEELRRVLRALKQKLRNVPEAHRHAIRLLLLTMVRKSELRLARWVEVDLKRAEWVIPAGRTKMGREMLVPLSDGSLECLRELRAMQGPRVEMVLPGREALTWPLWAGALNRTLAKVARAAHVEHFTVHDLRRTASTLLTEAGWKAEVVEKALGHEIGGVRGVYNRAAYAAERREMLEAWAAKIKGLGTRD